MKIIVKTTKDSDEQSFATDGEFIEPSLPPDDGSRQPLDPLSRCCVWLTPAQAHELCKWLAEINIHHVVRDKVCSRCGGAGTI